MRLSWGGARASKEGLHNPCRSVSWTSRIHTMKPEALAQLRRIQRPTVRINQAQPITGISTINDTKAKVLEILNIKKPTQNAQMSLL